MSDADNVLVRPYRSQTLRAAVFDPRLEAHVQHITLTDVQFFSFPSPPTIPQQVMRDSCHGYRTLSNHPCPL